MMDITLADEQDDPLPSLDLEGLARTALEDRFLVENLAGYAEYTERVKWRLLPGIW